MISILTLLTLLCIFSASYGEINPYESALKAHPWKSVQRYVEVRPGAFIFYWLYYADGSVVGAGKKPMIIWIQGGPGLAASGVANFAEIGPFTMDMKPRNHTWVKGRNLLLIDHPVGTGFSYAVNKSLHVKTDREAATDLSRVIKVFFRRHKEFRKTNTYLFGQSYGGKLLPRLAYYLHTAIENSRTTINLKGIGIGSGWVNPKESTSVQPDFLYNMGFIDQRVYLEASKFVKQMTHYIDKKEYSLAGTIDGLLFNMLNDAAKRTLNYNNINQDIPYPALSDLEDKVNKYVKPTLAVVNQSLEWHYIADDVFQNLNSSFLIPSTKFLEMLLNKTQLKVAVYNGNLDVVTPLAGASNWAHKLRWHGAEEFKNAERYQIRGTRNGFYKTAKQFSFWWVFGAGHWVPEDNPVAMEQILEHVIGD